MLSTGRRWATHGYTQAGTTPNLTWFTDTGAKAVTDYRYVVTATIPQTQGGNTVNVETAASFPALASPGPIPSPIGGFSSYDVGTSSRAAQRWTVRECSPSRRAERTSGTPETGCVSSGQRSAAMSR